MASVGPQPPPGATGKRKRPDDDDANSQRSCAESSQEPSPSSDSSSKRPRTIGPTLPPANLDERPLKGIDDTSEESSDDDDFGPRLPPAGGSANAGRSDSDPKATSQQSQAPAKSVRDEWMLVPPSSGDWTSKVDPTKLKNRKFNTGKGAKGPSQSNKSDDTLWHETPAEKQERLQREIMGIKDTKRWSKTSSEDDGKTAESVKKLREYTEKARGPTLYTVHQESNPREKEDDPSARAFDREKDIAGGMKINTTQRTEMMKKAADFGSRFSTAKYL